MVFGAGVDDLEKKKTYFAAFGIETSTPLFPRVREHVMLSVAQHVFVTSPQYGCNYTPDINNIGIYTIQGRDSSVGIATRYGMAGPGIESWWGREFPQPSRLVLGSNQSLIK